jgi:hypothetical protein
VETLTRTAADAAFLDDPATRRALIDRIGRGYAALRP